MYFPIRVALPSLFASVAYAAIAPKPVPPPSTAASTATSGQSTFQQLIDHKNPSLGTFSQRYWWNSGWWEGAGSPVKSPFYVVELLSILTNNPLGGPIHSWRRGGRPVYGISHQQDHHRSVRTGSQGCSGHA